jgi:BolA protein
MSTQNIGPVATEMKARLERALSPAHLVITNDSAAHAGHSGDDGSGESHFTVELTCAAFDGLSRIAKQRLVYAALGDLMTTHIHALVIKAL